MKSGALQADDAMLDDDVYVAKIVSDIEVPHVKILARLNQPHPELKGHLNLQIADRLWGWVSSNHLAYNIIATLERHGLIRGWSRADYEALGASTKAALGASARREPVLYSITRLGSLMLNGSSRQRRMRP